MMKIFNAGIKMDLVMFACGQCGAVWASPKEWEMPSMDGHYSKWAEQQTSGTIFYRRSKTGKTFICKCPNCGQDARTPAALHNAYMNYLKELS